VTLSLIGNLGPSAGHERWVRHAIGLDDPADLDRHVGDDPHAASLILVGRDTAESHGMQRFGLANHVPLAGHQWRKGGQLCTFAPSPASLATLPDGPAARASLRRVLMAELILGCPTLRPWHFRLRDAQTLHDLGVAWCPAAPVAGMAFALFAADAHRQRAALLASPLSRAVHDAFPTTADHVKAPAWDRPMREASKVFLATAPAAIVASLWSTSRYAVEAFLPQCPPLTAHDAARGILLRHMAEFAT